MDFDKDKTRNQEGVDCNPDVSQAHFYESNAGHLSVQTTSPFRMKLRDSEFKADQTMKSKKEKNINIINKKLPYEACSSVTSKLLVNQIIKDNDVDGDAKEVNTENSRRKTDGKSNYCPHFTNNHIQSKRSIPIFNYKSSRMHLGLCPKEESLTACEVENRSSKKQIFTSNSTYSEKTTCCSSNVSLNQDFMYKTLEKNARLQKIVKNLICARKKEKEVEAWNSYINRLRRKYISDYGDYIDEHQTEYEYRDTNTCSELLQDIYLASEGRDSNLNYVMPRSSKQTSLFKNQPACYPISSQGRFMMLSNERGKKSFSQDSVKRSHYGHTIVADRENKRVKLSQERTKARSSVRKYTKENKILLGVDSRKKYDICQKHNTIATQTVTDKSVTTSINSVTDERKITNTFSEQSQVIKISHNVDRLNRRLQNTVEMDEPRILTKIENKLDTLISSLNTFIEEVKLRRNEKQCYNCHSVNFDHYKSQTNESKSETFGLIKAEKLVCGILTQSKTKPIEYNRDIFELNYNRILSDEIDNRNKVTEEIKNMLSSNTVQTCSVQMSIDIPIKDKSTEVTNSFVKAKLLSDRSVSVANVGQNTKSDSRKMTIAVNTDPLGWLALLRISADTMKQLLSYMPNIPYYSYLSLLHTSQLRMHSDYVCNICGASFERPSQLSDHIQSHELGNTKDCCVCRHILDMQSQRVPGLFRCQYCCQQFTRAYCCELHQESCAKRFGLQHDVRPSLMILS